MLSSWIWDTISIECSLLEHYRNVKKYVTIFMLRWNIMLTSVKDHVKDFKVKLAYLSSHIPPVWNQTTIQLLNEIISSTVDCKNLPDKEKRLCDTFLQ